MSNVAPILGHKSVRSAARAMGIDINHINRIARKHNVQPREALMLIYKDEPTYNGVHGLRAIAEAHGLDFRTLSTRHRRQGLSIEDSVLSLTDDNHAKIISDRLYKQGDDRRRAKALARRFSKYCNGRDIKFVKSAMSEFKFFFTPGCRYPDQMSPLLKQVLGIK